MTAVSSLPRDDLLGRCRAVLLGGAVGDVEQHVLRAAEFDIGDFCHTILYFPSGTLACERR